MIPLDQADLGRYLWFRFAGEVKLEEAVLMVPESIGETASGTEEWTLMQDLVAAVDDPAVLATVEAPRHSIQSESKLFILDLGSARWVELHSLFLFLGMLARYTRLGYQPLILLPASDATCKYLISHRYFANLTDVLGCAPRDFLTASGVARLEMLASELAEEPTDDFVEVPGHGKERLLPRQYYDFRSYPTANIESRERFADGVALPWGERYARQVLITLMGRERGDYVARLIIFQAIENALIHPNATIIQHGAQHEQSPYLPLKVSVWDDGDSIVDTLRRPLEAGERIIRKAAGVRPVRVRRRVTSYDQAPRVDFLSSDDIEPTASMSSWELLFISLLPGVSSRAASDVQLGAHQDLLVGLGLHNIATTVSRDYEGVFEIRTANLSLRVRPARPDAAREFDYYCDIHVSDPVLGGFQGNLLSVSLPAKQPGRAE